MSPPHSAFLVPSADQPQELISRESRIWLGQHHVGCLNYMSGCGPRSVCISYALVGDRILFQVPDYNEIAHYAPGARVSFAVDEGAEPATPAIDPGPMIEGIKVTGTAELESETDGSPPGSGCIEESWPDGVRTSIVTLPLTDLQVSERAPT